MTPIEQLANRWREDAETLERYHDAALAAVCREHADALVAALRDAGDEALTLAEAAAESGFSRDRLRHLVADGSIANVGVKGSPRIRRADVPRKATAAPAGFDASAVARRLTARKGGE